MEHRAFSVHYACYEKLHHHANRTNKPLLHLHLCAFEHLYICIFLL